jgi:SNF family Na+-dependent transporter
MGFMQDNFNWKRIPSALLFGALVGLLGIPCVLSQDAFNEFDYWAGTVALVIFALVEIILFAWVFGMEKGWKEINEGADIKVPIIFKYIIKYVSPVFLLIVFIGGAPAIWENATKDTSNYGMLARILMIVLFLAISVLVYIASKNIKKQNV